MYPLLDPLADREPDYLTLEDAIATGVARVTEVSQTGSVPTLALRNDADLPVLILDGEELVGAKQNRVVNLTILAPSQHRLEIPVSCVEGGRWSYRTSHFEASPRTMAAAARARKTRDVNASLRAHGGRHADQGAVWEDVDRYASALGVHSKTAAMSDVFEQRRESVESYASAFAPLAGQVGAVFAFGDRPVGVELFDAARMFRM